STSLSISFVSILSLYLSANNLFNNIEKDVFATCSSPILSITSSTLTSPAFDEIIVSSLESVALLPQAPNNNALAVTGIITFLNVFMIGNSFCKNNNVNITYKVVFTNYKPNIYDYSCNHFI